MEKEYSRNLWPILGLPIDAVNMRQTIDKIYQAIEDNEKLFISTPNINFIVTALNNQTFRQSIINSDLSIADGLPLIWVARMLRIPILEKVSGSNLAEELMLNKANRERPIRVFFFGGEEGVAEQACIKLNSQHSGLTGAGSYYPGFGSVADMSRQSVIDKINQSNADFIVVALGAQKGQEWIECNRKHLNAPVISHLGAMINFIAGTKSRAPLMLQKLGCEWLWRIKEEPALWNRYFRDGIQFLKLLFTRVIPYSFFIRRRSERPNDPSENLITVDNQSLALFMPRVILEGDLDLLKNKLSDIPKNTHLTLNFEKTEYIDPSVISFLITLRKVFGNKLTISDTSTEIKKIIKYNCAEYLFDSQV